MNHAAELLKCYLDESGFDGIFKYLSALNFYYLTPARINSLCEITSESVDRIVDKGSDRWELLKCCMLMKEIPFSSLDTQEKRVAEALIESDFLQLKDGIVSNAGYQLISHRGQYLFIDARINYRHLGRHEVYIGFDTYLMLYYIETGRISRNNRCLDLCTGSGIAGLVLSDYAENVVATDIAEQPLKLSRFNCHLNAKENRLTIKNENFVDTLCKKEKYDFVTCNPPFVAFPKDLEAPIFARGYDFDGLGHYRMLFSKIRNYVNENGAAYFVSDLIGDENEPYFVSELKKYAMDIGLQIDLFIDNRLDAKYQLVGYPPFLKLYNPGFSTDELRAKINHFLIHDLKAKYYYLTTIVVRVTSVKPRLRMFKRYRDQKNSGAFPSQQQFDINTFLKQELYEEYFDSVATV